MHVEHVESLWVAATPLCVFIGAAIAFYWFTEYGDDDPVPEVKREAREDEPWGLPYYQQRYRIPGDSVQRTRRCPEDDTTTLTVVTEDERMHV
jgi:hypothetical protein